VQTEKHDVRHETSNLFWRTGFYSFILIKSLNFNFQIGSIIKAVSPCDDFSNNIDKLYHYRMSIKPFDNFVLKHPTTIQYDKHKYAFEGYSIFSHEPLENIPESVVVVYNNEYKLSLVKEEMNENCFTIKELELLKQYVFVELLELYDLKWKGYQVDESACNRFHVMPRYCRTLPCKLTFF